jgi:hypothetical protein
MTLIRTLDTAGSFWLKYDAERFLLYGNPNTSEINFIPDAK